MKSSIVSLLMIASVSAARISIEGGSPPYFPRDARDLHQLLNARGGAVSDRRMRRTLPEHAVVGVSSRGPILLIRGPVPQSFGSAAVARGENGNEGKKPHSTKGKLIKAAIITPLVVGSAYLGWRVGEKMAGAEARQ
ncbi:hypothetical protein CF319_g8306 [Tilletia indica]|nr:hypothetical protein CF319_g8306 [Tilletia indica]